MRRKYQVQEQNSAQRAHHRHRHCDHADLQKIPEAYIEIFLADGQQPENGCNLFFYVKFRTEIYTDQNGVDHGSGGVD